MMRGPGAGMLPCVATVIVRHKLVAMSSVSRCLLAFDTSTQALAVALHCGGHAFCVNSAGGAAASAALLPHVHALLRQAHITLQQVQAIAFGSGPGAFTGLRTACAVAQGLGLGLQRPLLPIDSLMIAAEDARVQAGDDAPDFDVQVAMDARMDEIYAGRYRWQQGRWQVMQAPALLSLPDFVQQLAAAPAGAAAGSALQAFAERLAWPVSTRLFMDEQDRAAALLRLALLAQDHGEGIAAELALPLYLRDKVAHTTAEREAARVLANVT
jgi:tRNA threonylcarbamoyladenosine biosynthesis protein TsaB